MLNLEDIKRILDLVREHELSEFELERDGLKIRVRKDALGQVVAQPVLAAPAPAASAAGPAPRPAAATAPAEAPAAPADDSLEFAVVKSPIVGTFYRVARARRAARSPTSGPASARGRCSASSKR